MPGISGLISSGASLDNPNEILGIFRDAHSLKGVSFVHREFESDYCVITNMLTGLLKTTLNQPASDSTGNTCLFLEGEIFNAEELLGYLNGSRQSLSLCDILLALFLKRGADFISLVNGEFNIVIYQKAERRLIILNDHLASKPLYYMQQGNCLLFGSEKKSILAVAKRTPTIDPIGLLQIFAHPYNVGDRTYIKGLERLFPSSRLDYHEGNLRLTRHHLLTFRALESAPRVDVLLDEWCDCLQRATIRRLEGKERVLISLSGGLDSRAVACSIPRDFRPIWSRTRGVPDSLEVIYATEIAKQLSFNYFREDPTTVPYSEIIPKIVWRTECETPFANCLSISNHPVIKEYGDFIAGGWYGDVTSGAHIYPYMFLPCSRQQFIDKVYQWHITCPPTSLCQVFNTEFVHKNFPYLRGAFFDSFALLEGETNIQVYEIWDLYNRLRRMTISSMPEDSYLFEHIRPFADRDYLDFVLTLPTRLRFGQSLYQAMIYWLGPEVRSIPNSNNKLKVHSTVSANLLNKGLALGLKARTRLLRRINPSYRNGIERAACEDITRATRQDQGFRRIIEEFVRSSYFDTSIFNGPGIMNLLDSHYRGEAGYTDLLCKLATFAVGLPYFVYNHGLIAAHRSGTPGLRW